MHDVAWAEKNGIPSVAILSDAFVPQSNYNAACLGQKDLARLVVQHPIQDLRVTDETYNHVRMFLV